jgi:CRISPR-associated protein Cmr1
VGNTWQATGKGYLLWTMAKSGKAEKGNLKKARWYFPKGTSFHVTLSTRDTDTARLEQAIAAFWLFTQLGGLGARSRRCAGSLSVQPAEGYQTAFPFAKAVNIQQLKRQLEQGLKKAREGARQSLGQSAQNPLGHVPQADFDMLAKGTCRIWLLQETHPWPGPEAVMDALGTSLQTYRRGIAISKRTIFGLPLSTFSGRRASPLLLRVIELQDARYAGIAVLFKTAASGIQPGDYTIIENWIATFPGALEVEL